MLRKCCYFVFFLFCFYSYAQEVGYWPLDGDSLDASSLANVSSSANLVYSDGQIGQSAYFNGTSSYIRVTPDLMNLGDSFSVSLWMKADNGVDNVRLIDNRGTGGSVPGWQLKIRRSGEKWRISTALIEADNGTQYRCDSCGSVYDYGQWYNVIMVFNQGSDLSFYVNGVLDGVVNVGSVINYSNALPIVIGGALVDSGVEGTSSQFFKGFLDDVKIYNSALTAAEIAAINANFPDWVVGENQLTYNGGSVGIGTDNPAAPLHIEINDSSFPNLLLTSNNSTPWIRMVNDSTSETFNIFNGSAGFRIDDNGGGAEFEINNNGTIKLGQSNNAFLEIEGTAAGGDVIVQNDLWVNGTIFGTMSGNPVNENTLSLVNDTTNVTYNFVNGSVGLRIDDNGGGAEMEINNNGNIKLGENNSGYLEIEGSAQGGDVLVQNDLWVNGTIFGSMSVSTVYDNSLSLINDTTGVTFNLINGSAGFRIDDNGGGAEMEINNNGTITLGQSANSYLEIEGTALGGDVSIQNDLVVFGTFSNPSDVNLKEEFEVVDTQSVLEKLVELPITTWTYKRDDDRTRHMGVMAQDFYAAFGLGRSDRLLTSIDPDGVAMAAIQGLNRKVETKSDEIAHLKQENRELKDRLAVLEEMVKALAKQIQ
ncbi:MAG: tail fiber domain-containing protein [Acidobacteriota bacterium]|nr:tail fiber domain-containing protein [Acidobacteriota bacterium]